DVVKATFVVSARQRKGIGPVVECLRGRITTLAGPSGVGKSALLNAISPGYARDTGDVSRKLGRGRHTTRAVELLALPGGGLVADTPGFSVLELRDIPAARLSRFWPDLDRLSDQCRFPGCRHRSEPDCAVRRAAETGAVHPRRYQHYLDLLEEIEEWEARRWS
ncbi:MAG: ribosome small subunit-dependent GTPase A, partial [Limnochordales bacterium]